MKTKNIVLTVLAGINMTSCTQTATDKQPHQIETINELLDSCASRGFDGQRTLRCFDDSGLYEEYFIGHSLSTAEIKDSASYDKEWLKEMKRSTDYHYFLLQNGLELLDRLCKTAEKSYRYISGDSIDYNLTMNSENSEKLYLRSYKRSSDDNIFLSYMVKKSAEITKESVDVKPIQELLTSFLSEQKGVKKYKVDYVWDQDVAIPEDYGVILTASVLGHGSDSLAASAVTGTHYFIPAKDQHRIDVAVDFYNRLNRMATERPLLGSLLNTSAKFKTSVEDEWYVDLLRYSVFNRETKRRIYTIMMEQSAKGIHILELYTPDAPRFAIPRLWLKVKQTHNLDIIPEKDFKELY